jgi:hypothetical protein
MTLPAALARVGALGVLGAAALGAAACDECAGVPACRVAAVLSYTGRVIDFKSGRGVPGVTVVFRRAAGLTLDADSLVAVTDAEGLYRFASAASYAGDVVGSLTVRPPAPLLAYAVDTVRLSAHDVRGAGGVLPTLVAQPYVSFVGGLTARRTGGAATEARVVFTRRSGARLAVDSIVSTADVYGFFYLQAPALETGSVTGDLKVIGGTLSRVYVIPNVTLPVVHDDQLPFINANWRVGASLDYSVRLAYRGSNAPVAGASVEFRRTSGLALTSAPVVATTDADGSTNLHPVPATEDQGEVVGDLTVRAPGLRAPYVVHGVRLQTFDAEGLRFGGLYGVGYAAIAAGALEFRGDRSPLSGATVRFVRTSGVGISPDTVLSRTLSDGRFGIIATADSAGEVVGDLLVRSDSSSATTRIPGVRLLARDDDTVRFAGNYAVGGQLLYVGVLYQTSGGAPAAGWRVTFRRTGGIRLVTDTLVSTSLDWGGFALNPATREEGTVEGTLEARSPSGDRVVRLGTVRLETHADDEVRLAGNWLLDAPAVRAP